MYNRPQRQRPKARAVTPPTDVAEVDAPALREPVTLVKGPHRWMFACDAGEEPLLLKRLSELASDRAVPFDWFDAALVSHQLSKRLKPGLQRIDGSRPAPKPGTSGN